MCGCEEQDATISAASNSKVMPSANEARQAMDTISQVKRTSQTLQAKQESLMKLMIFTLSIIGIALPLLFWLLQRKFMAEQEQRLARRLEQREIDVKNEIVDLERKMMDVTQQQRSQLIAELEQLRQKSLELDRTTREMFSEALHNFKNTRILKKPGFIARLFGFGKNRMNIPENTTIVQINRPQNESQSFFGKDSSSSSSQNFSDKADN